MEPASRDAYRLFNEGSAALAQIEVTGMPVDMERLDAADKEISGYIRGYESTLRESVIYSTQRARFGKDSNVNSRDQLAVVLYQDRRLAGAKRSAKTGKYTLDDKDLADLQDHQDTPEEVNEYLRTFRKLQKLYKMKSTYLDGFRREAVNGRIHGFFNLHKVKTYRLSSDSPNLQNIPVRDPVVGKVLRSLIRPSRDGYVIVETDYKTLELITGGSLHKDPNMRDHLLTGYDFHKETANDLFLIEGAVTKVLRNIAKISNFSLVYGDYYASIATKAWKAAIHEKIGERTVREHLAAKGIKHLGAENFLTDDSFMLHTKGVVDRFWEVRFPTFHKWRNRIWEDYCRRGYLYTATGFRVAGVFKRNEIYNIETQGVSAHCMLYALIQAQKEIAARRMGSRIISTIHDSVLAEVPEHEVDSYIEMMNECMTARVMEKWDWINIPLATEAEVGSPDWATKKPYEKAA